MPPQCSETQPKLMPITDKIAAAKKISEFLNTIFAAGDFRLRYKITVDPPVVDREWERPEFWSSSPAPTARWCWKTAASCCAPSSKSSWRCCVWRPTSTRRSASTARTSAPRVSRSCAWPPTWRRSVFERRACLTPSRPCRRASAALCTWRCAMSRILRTESAGEAAERHVVVYPKDYKGKPPARPMSRRR